MVVEKSDIVVSRAGRDKGKIFFVREKDGTLAYLANGKKRKIKTQKKRSLSTCNL